MPPEEVGSLDDDTENDSNQRKHIIFEKVPQIKVSGQIKDI